MRMLGPLVALLAIATAVYVLYDKRAQYESRAASQVDFPGDLRSALAQAKAQDKKVVAMFTASWCGPCQYMKKEVLPSSAVRAQAGRFVWVFLDVDQSKNKAAARDFGVGGIPSFHILNANGRQLDKIVGSRDPQVFAGILAKY